LIINNHLKSDFYNKKLSIHVRNTSFGQNQSNFAMDISHPDYTLQAGPSPLQNVLVGLRRVFTSDPALTLQIFLIMPLIIGGIILQLNVIQWVLILVVTMIFLLAGIFRTAALLQIKNDTSITPFHVTRIRCMGNVLVTITAGISLFTYMMVFVPKITQLL